MPDDRVRIRNERLLEIVYRKSDVGASLIYINFYVDDRNLEEFRPGEIGMVGFTVKDGCFHEFSMIVDPKDDLGGRGVEAIARAEKYGIPPPGTTPKLMDYTWIVDGLEDALKSAQGQDPSHGYFIFAKKGNVGAYKKALNWLYQKAGRGRCPHDIMPFESLVWVLCRAGKRHVPGFKREKMLQDLERMDHCWMHSLACEYHQDKDPKLLPPGMREWRRRLPRDKWPSVEIARCAILKANNQLYVALGIIMKHYMLPRHLGNHVPNEKEELANQSQKLTPLIIFN